MIGFLFHRLLFLLSRCNISYLDEWLKERKLQSSEAIHTLKPLSQAAWLLQVNKSNDDDAKEIAEKCTDLRPVQVPLHNQCFSEKFVGPALNDTLLTDTRLRFVTYCKNVSFFLRLLKDKAASKSGANT